MCDWSQLINLFVSNWFTLLVLSKFDNIAMKRSPWVMQCSRKHCPVFHLTFFLFVLQNVLWTPSKVIARLGKEINNESSYLYWAYKVNVYQIELNFMHTSRIYFFILLIDKQKIGIDKKSSKKCTPSIAFEMDVEQQRNKKREMTKTTPSPYL